MRIFIVSKSYDQNLESFLVKDRIPEAKVSHFHNPIEAVNAVRAEGAPDVLITGNIFSLFSAAPGVQNGVALCAWFKLNYPNTKTVLLTGDCAVNRQAAKVVPDHFFDRCYFNPKDFLAAFEKNWPERPQP